MPLVLLHVPLGCACSKYYGMYPLPVHAPSPTACSTGRQPEMASSEAVPTAMTSTLLTMSTAYLVEISPVTGVVESGGHGSTRIIRRRGIIELILLSNFSRLLFDAYTFMLQPKCSMSSHKAFKPSMKHPPPPWPRPLKSGLARRLQKERGGHSSLDVCAYGKLGKGSTPASTRSFRALSRMLPVDANSRLALHLRLPCSTRVHATATAALDQGDMFVRSGAHLHPRRLESRQCSDQLDNLNRKE
ncbi:hypothetical protein FB451DRAFT_1169876 [Mycena latifolia]|nr:hypothetical protein FB451DRAFT_1169876 [Mycena latifolia]